MIRLSLSLCVLVIMSQSPARAQECDCPGTQIARFKGDHDTPLSWVFITSVVTEARSDVPPLMCYSRTVHNTSTAPVFNVSWKIAGYERRVIREQRPNSSCPQLSGFAESSPKSGPLYYGISSEHYDTNVLPPRAGWMQQAAAPTSTDLAISIDLHAVRSVFDVDTVDASTQLVVYSSASTDDRKFYQLKYEIENRGNVPVFMIVNLPIAGSMDKDLPFVSGFWIQPETRQTFYSKASEPVDVQRATVLVLDQNKKGLAADVVGVYAPSNGKRFLSDESLFNEVH